VKEDSDFSAKLAAAYPGLDAGTIAAHLCGMSLKTPSTSKKGTETPTSERPEKPGDEPDDGADDTGGED
jgi:hypothetical protein